MAYDKEFLDRIRSAIKVSEVVGRKFTLRKQGAEHVAVEDKSITVNDRKGMWYDFGKGEGGGDIFKFLEVHEGYSFPDAVEILAAQANIAIPGKTRHAAATGKKQNVEQRAADHDHSGETSGDPRDFGDGARHADTRSQGFAKKEVVATFDITDAQGALIYQVARVQRRLPDGSFEIDPKSGKPAKTFWQRRKSPDQDGTWVLGLDFVDRDKSQPLEFMRKGPGADWMRFDEGNFVKWKWKERRTFPGIGNVEHWLYNANEVAPELAEDPSDQRTIFIPEGEGKVDLLRDWGLLATSSTGGAKNFTAACAAFFKGAADVVILEDNDTAGKQRTARIAPMLKRAGARVRVLNFSTVWPDCPVKGDIKDWRDRAGGDRVELLTIVDKLPEWTPEPYRSRFGAVKWRDQYLQTTRVYEWVIKGLVPFGKSLLIYGESQSGKSFETFDMSMACATGKTFAGRKCKQVGVIYCAAEKGPGFVNRMHAYAKHNDIDVKSDLPFAVLTKSLDLWSEDATTDILIEEIKALSEDWTVPLGIVVLDTYQAATPGASIIKDEDVTTMYKRAQRIMDKTGAGVWFVHHKNAHGTIRGSLVLWNAIETTIEIDIRKNGEGKNATELRDDDRRIVRRATVRKQSEGIAGDHWDFVLKQVKVGTDEDGDDVTSCVTVEPHIHTAEAMDRATKDGPKPEGYALTEINATIFKAMLKAIAEDGIIPPASMKLPASVPRIVKWADVRTHYRRVTPNEELGDTPEKRAASFKSRVGRFRRILMGANIIAGDKVILQEGGEETDVIWPLGKRVYGRGLSWPRQKKEEPPPEQASGNPQTEEEGTPSNLSEDLKSVF